MLIFVYLVPGTKNLFLLENFQGRAVKNDVQLKELNKTLCQLFSYENVDINNLI